MDKTAASYTTDQRLSPTVTDRLLIAYLEDVARRVAWRKHDGKEGQQGQRAARGAWGFANLDYYA